MAKLCALQASWINLNIISKIALNALKLLDVGIKRKVSIKGKRFITSLNPKKYIEMLLEV